MKIYCCGCKKHTEAKLVNGDIVYPHRDDLYNLNFYMCECGLYVGTHKNSSKNPKPLGCIATQEIKNARQHIHKILDPIWEEKLIGRKTLYKLISDSLNYKYHTANIRSVEEAREVYKIILEIRKNIKYKRI